MSMDTKELLIGKGFTEDEADSILDTINGSDLIDLINLLTGDSNKSQIIDFLNSQIYLESLFKSMGDFHHILPLDLNESLIGFSYKILPNGKNDEIMDFMEKYNIDFLINNENEFYLECDNNSKLSLLDDFLINLTKGKSPIKKDVSMSKHIKEGIMGMSKIKSLGRLRELAGLPPAPEAEPFDDQSSGDNFDDIDIDDNDGFEDAGVPGDLPPIGDNNVVPVQNSPAMSSIQDAINNISSSLSDLKVSEYKQVVNQLTSLLNNARDTGRNFLGERAVYKKKVTESARSMDGEAIKVGDFVGFKSGIEQSGKVVAINNGMLTISVYDSETGERENVVQPARRCWLDN